jgi:integrase
MMERTRYPGIYRRGASYVAVVSYKRGDGLRAQKWITAPTLGAVKAKRDELVGQMRKGLKPHRGQQTLTDFLGEWLEEVRVTRRPLTHKNYGSLIKVHVVPAIGGTKLVEVDKEILKALYRTLSAATARNVHAMLSAAFTYAVQEQGSLSFNPCANVKSPTYKRKKPAHLDEPEIVRMLETARGTRLEGVVVLGLDGGLRIAEASDITWGEINWTTGDLKVDSSYWGETKSGKERSLTLSASGLERLKRFRVRQAQELLALGIRQDDHTHVATNAFGQPMTVKRLSEAFKAFCEEHAFNVRWHGLRHSNAIAMLINGVDANTAAGRLGHANPAFTMAVYGDFVKSADRAAATKLDKVFGGEVGS